MHSSTPRTTAAQIVSIILPPRAPDRGPTPAPSLKDGLVEGAECDIETEACPDTDKDGTPDPLDGDNDGDGVPDRLDAAPTQVVSGSFADGKFKGLDKSLLSFRVDKVTPGEELFVDFQLRPVHDDTFGTTGKDANGDLRLVPMLEIEIPFKAGTFSSLPVLNGISTMPEVPKLDNLKGEAYQKAVDGWFGQWLDTTKTKSLVLTGISAGLFSEAQQLSVTAVSSNPAILPHPEMTFVIADAPETGSVEDLRFQLLADQVDPSTLEGAEDDGGESGPERLYLPHLRR